MSGVRGALRRAGSGRPAGSGPLLAGLLAALALGGCGEPRGRPLELRVDVVRALGCAPGSPLRRFALEALGPGPFEPARQQQWEAGGEPAPVPADTRLLRLRAWDGAGWSGLAGAALPDADEPVGLLLSPPGRSCPLADPALALPEGAAVAVAGGRAWLLGGLEGARGRRQVVRYREGERLARMDARLALPRAEAAAALEPTGAALLSGGWPAAGSLAHDTVERVGPGEPGELLQPPLLSPRAGHRAVLLPGGELLLVGGRPAEGEPLLRRAERWREGTGSVPVAQPQGRWRPALRRDALGAVWAAGGLDEAGEPAGGLWRLPPGGSAFEEVAELPALRDGALLPLGAISSAWVGLEPVEGRPLVVTVHPAVEAGAPPHLETWRPPLPPMRRLAAAALPGGVLLLVGLDEAGRRLGAWLQPGWRLAERVEASRAARVLLPLAGGAVLELGRAGGSLRQAEARSPWEPVPPAWVPLRAPAGAAAAGELLLEGASDWRLRAGRPEALRAGAALEVGALRFEGLRTELRGEGGWRLWLLGEGEAAAVTARDGRLQAGAGCALPLGEEEDWAVEREGPTLWIEAGGARRRCEAAAPSGPVALRLEALGAGSLLRAWRGRRR